MIVTALAVALLGSVGSVSEPIEPLAPSMVELFLSTEGGESSCGAYQAAGELATLAGSTEYVGMMQEMAEAYLFVQFETIMSEEFGGQYRLTDEARETYHTYLATC